METFYSNIVAINKFHGDGLNGVRYQKTSKRTSGGYVF